MHYPLWGMQCRYCHCGPLQPGVQVKIAAWSTSALPALVMVAHYRSVDTIVVAHYSLGCSYKLMRVVPAHYLHLGGAV